jgi:hypothetical protein
MKRYIAGLFTFIFLLGAASAVQAGDCYVDPVIEYAGSGTIESGVFMRDQACMEGSNVLATLSAGTSVSVIGYTDGWYRVEANGGRGWIGMQFLNNGASETGKQWGWGEYHAYMSAYPSMSPNAAAQPAPAQNQTQNRTALMSRVRGYILLQVEEHGEAWYVDPMSDRRYYMKDGPTAYQMMRSFGLGVSEADYASMAAGNWSMKHRLRGRIILRVQEHGEAYYIHPDDLTMYYLKDGDEAYRIMRLYSLGITNTDLTGITEDAIPIK